MKAILLAAGHGSRLRPLTDTIPKAMVAVGGMPVIEHNLLLVKKHGIADVIVNLHAHPDAVPAYVGDGRRWGLRVLYSYEKDLLGTAGAVKRVQHILGDDTFAVVYADNLSDCDLTALGALQRRSSAVATIALHAPHDPRSSGIVRLDRDGRVRGFVEKPREYDPTMGSWANAGIYVMEPSVLELIPPDQPYDFGHDVFPRLLATGRPIFAAHACTYHLTIDTPARHAEAQRVFRARY